ncbi:MAG TPA: hypothetical protein VKF14_18080 [Candidatus Dormibacteraeota bacterium]|nr:hypothetical protein [Candidatus Dormibacteraeota bacterium]
MVRELDDQGHVDRAAINRRMGDPADVASAVLFLPPTMPVTSQVRRSW